MCSLNWKWVSPKNCTTPSAISHARVRNRKGKLIMREMPASPAQKRLSFCASLSLPFPISPLLSSSSLPHFSYESLMRPLSRQQALETLRRLPLPLSNSLPTLLPHPSSSSFFFPSFFSSIIDVWLSSGCLILRAALARFSQQKTTPFRARKDIRTFVFLTAR